MQKVASGPVEYSELRGFGAAAGVALTTTLALTSIPINATYISMAARNFSGAGVARFLVNPTLTIVATTNALVGTTGVRAQEPTALSEFPVQEISDEMQDGDAENFAIDLFDTAANGNFIYVGSWVQFRGAAVDLSADVNAAVSTLTVNYWNGNAWTDISDTDGTQTGGNTTMGQDGDVTWTVPTDWERASLRETGDTLMTDSWAGADLYWTRWEVSVALDTVDLVQLRSLNRSTDYAGLLEGEGFDQAVDPDYACVEALTDAGTANLVLRAGITPKMVKTSPTAKFR